MTEFRFTPPTIDEGPAGGNRLFYFYKLARGITIVKSKGVYSQVRYLVDEDAENKALYQEVYFGGRYYDVDATTKAALIAADVGVTENNFTAL